MIPLDSSIPEILKCKGVLCDLDGLLADTETLHWEAYRQTLAPYGIDVTRQMFIESWLSGIHYGTVYHLNRMGVTDLKVIKEVRKKKEDLYIEFAEKQKIQFMPGAEEFLKVVKEHGISCGIGTGGYRHEYEYTIKACGLEKYVQVTLGGDEVAHNKPAPDLFLEVAKQLGVAPTDCVVFENSSIGLHAAEKGNIPCIIVPSEWTVTQDFTGALRVLKSLTEVLD